MMSADTLRRAAAPMRERAACGDPRAFPAPWATSEADVERYGVAAFVTCEDGKGDVTDALDPTCAEHIASWHPAVALAVADMLERNADEASLVAHTRITSPTWECGCIDCRPTPAVTVARAYLGES